MHSDTEARTSDLATYYTIPQVAARVGVSPDTIRRRIKSGELNAVFFAKKYRITAADMEALLREKAA